MQLPIDSIFLISVPCFYYEQIPCTHKFRHIYFCVHIHRLGYIIHRFRDAAICSGQASALGSDKKPGFTSVPSYAKWLADAIIILFEV